MLVADLTKDHAQKILKSILKNMDEAEGFDWYNRFFPDFTDIYEKRNKYRSSEHVVAKLALKHPDLHPLMVEVVEAIIEFNANEPLWEDEDEHAGAHFARELALYSREYIGLYTEYLASNDLNHEVYQSQDIQAIARKWSATWDKDLYHLLLTRLFTPGQHYDEDIWYMCNTLGLAKHLTGSKEAMDSFFEVLGERYDSDESTFKNHFVDNIYPDDEEKQQKLMERFKRLNLVEINISRAIFDRDAVNDICERLMKEAEDQKDVLKNFFQDKGKYQYALLNQGYQGVDIIYCNKITPLLLDEKILHCAVDFVEKTACLTYGVSDYDDDEIEIEDLSQELLDRIKAVVEANGYKWCNPESNETIITDTHVTAGYANLNDTVDVNQILDTLQNTPSTNEVTTLEAGITMYQWFNNTAIANILKTFYTSCTLTKEEEKVFAFFVNRISQYANTSVMFYEVGKQLCPSVHCFTQITDSDTKFQAFGIIESGKSYLISIHADEAMMTKTDISPEFTTYLRNFIADLRRKIKK